MTATPSRSCRSASTWIGCDAVTPCPNAEALDRDRAGTAGCVDSGSKRGGREGSVRRRRLAWLRNAQVAQELVNVGYRADRAVPRTLRLDDGVRFLYPPCSDVAACLCAVRNGVTPACQGLDELTSLDGSQFVGLRGPVGGASVCSRSANPDSRRAAQCGPAPSNGSPPAVNRLPLFPGHNSPPRVDLPRSGRMAPVICNPRRRKAAQRTAHVVNRGGQPVPLRDMGGAFDGFAWLVSIHTAKYTTLR